MGTEAATLSTRTVASQATAWWNERRGARLATVAAVAPILFAGLRAAYSGWYPVGDDAIIALRAGDVLSNHPPLLSTWSSTSVTVGFHMNHPGPLQFELLALPVWLFGYGAGTAIGVALTNAAAVVALGWLVGRRLGPNGTTLAMACTALLVWSMGSTMLHEPWNPYATVLPFALFIVAVWCLACGDLVALPVVVLAGSFCLQVHLSHAVMVPGLAAVGLAGAGLQHWHARGETRRGTWRSVLVAVITLLVVWAPPLVEQAANGSDGNLARLVRGAGADFPNPSTTASLRAYGSTVAVPPFWLPPSYGSPAYGAGSDGRPLWLAGGGLLLLVALLVVLGWRAFRRRSVTVAVGCGVALAALALGYVTTKRMSMPWGFILEVYTRFMWPLSMVVWLVVLVGLWDEWKARSRPFRPAMLVAVLAVAAGVGALPSADNGGISRPWSRAALDALDDDVVAAARDRGSVLVRIEGFEGLFNMGPALLTVLDDAGVPFYLDDSVLLRQLGSSRELQPGKADAVLVVRSGPDATERPDGGREIARWTGDNVFDDPVDRTAHQVVVYLLPLDP